MICNWSPASRQPVSDESPIDQWSVGDTDRQLDARSVADQSETGRNRIARVNDWRLVANRSAMVTDLCATKLVAARLLGMSKRRSVIEIGLRLLYDFTEIFATDRRPTFELVASWSHLSRNVCVTGVLDTQSLDRRPRWSEGRALVDFRSYTGNRLPALSP